MTRLTSIIDSGSEGGWAAARSILSYGVRIGIRTNRPEMLDRMHEYLPPLWKPNTAPHVDRLFSLKIGGNGLRMRSRALHELLDDRAEAVSSKDLNDVLNVFEMRAKLCVAELARRRVFVHAGVVGWQGRAIIIPGRSMSGKTSLVVELVRAGATYYSDEYAALDTRGRVHAYPQPLEIREPGGTLQRKRQPEEIGGVVGTKPLPVGLVIVSNYKTGARWRPEKLSPGQAVLELLAHTVPARRKPEVVMPTLQRAVSKSIILKGVRGEAGEAAEFILKRLSSMESS